MHHLNKAVDVEAMREIISNESSMPPWRRTCKSHCGSHDQRKEKNHRSRSLQDSQSTHDQKSSLKKENKILMATSVHSNLQKLSFNAQRHQDKSSTSTENDDQSNSASFHMGGPQGAMRYMYSPCNTCTARIKGATGATRCSVKDNARKPQDTNHSTGPR